MYQVSNAFIEAMKSPVQEHRLTGTIGSISFSEANVVDGSFSISNQSTDTSDVVLGSCYVGQLTAEFVGINIAYGKWINKTITLSFGLKVGEYYEYVPMGVYKVKEAKHTDHGVQVTAYDNMIKFDKKFRKSHYMNLSGMTNIIDQLCLDAGVVCGMSHAQIEALPNGDRTGINIYGSTGKKAEFANDITTLRDLLFWVAQTLGCFATMNRAGQLEFRPYTQTVVDQITEQHRIAGATFADYVTHYIGIYVENLDDNTEDYYGYDATALQQELTETMGEITQDQEDITDLEADRAEWAQKLANHECTQEEYDAAIAEIDAQEKALTKDINQLSKRVEWLSNAIAQSADDGSDMVLGANPLVMAKNKTTRDQQRREILGALNAISYTPFQASVLCGCIYDLGDVIQFSGGLYNSDTDSFGCVMSYTYTHNGGTELEGFGADPSVVIVRNKTQKSVDRAQKNAVNAKEVTNGTGEPPADAKDGDIYVKTKEVRKDTHPLSLNDIHYIGYDIWRSGYTHPIDDPVLNFNVVSAVWEQEGYHIELEGMTFNTISYYYMNANQGAGLIKVPVTESGRYSFHAKIKLESTAPSRRQNDVVGFAIMSDTSDLFSFVPYGQFVEPSWWGGELNLREEQDNYYEYSASFTIPSGIASQGYFYICFMRTGLMTNSGQSTGEVKMSVKEFYITKTTETYDDTHEDAIDEIYNYVIDDTTGTGKWLKVDVGSLAGLSDTEINNPLDEQIIRWDAETQRWVNKTLVLGTAAAKDYTDTVASGNYNLPTSDAVANAIGVAVSAAYHAAGSKTVAQLVSSLLVAANEGCVYNMSDSGETTADFVEGEGVPIRVGDNVGVVNVGTIANPVYKFDLLSGFVDLSDYYDSDEVDDLLDAKANTSDLATVATSGAYADLSGQPTIPTKTSDLTNDSSFVADNPTFSEAATRTNIASGDSISTLFGKIKKWFSDLKDLAFVAKDGTSSTKYLRGDATWQSHDDVTHTFTQASSRANLTSGEKISVSLGKIMKWFADLKDLAFIAKDGTSSTKYLRGDGTWQAFPTIPTVNNGTLTIQKNGTQVATFTANQSGNSTANIAVPTKTSDLTNDSGFKTGTYAGSSSDGGDATRAIKLKDALNNVDTTMAYGKAGLNYSDYTWLAGWNGYELRAISKAQFAQNYVEGRLSNADAYTALAHGYYGGNAGSIWRIAFPDATVTVWTMINMTVSVRQTWSPPRGGKVMIHAYHASTSPYTWQGLKAEVIGSLTSDIKVYGSDGKYIYIGGFSGGYTTLQIDDLLIGDVARGQDFRSTTIDMVSELPETYQTASMIYYVQNGVRNVFIDNATNTPIHLKAGASSNDSAWAGYVGNNGTIYGYIGVASNGKPYFYDTARREIITSNTIGSQSVAYATSAGSATDSTKIPLSGTDALAGSIVPSKGDYFDLGSGTYPFNSVYSEAFEVGKKHDSSGTVVFWNFSNNYFQKLVPGTPSTHRTLSLPDADGTLATQDYNAPVLLMSKKGNGTSTTITSIDNFKYILMCVHGTVTTSFAGTTLIPVVAVTVGDNVNNAWYFYASNDYWARVYFSTKTTAKVGIGGGIYTVSLYGIK